ncbi:MAG: DUF808 domain-containing protein [Moraxellaceae bacterium]|nr:MAG: DUF808 domain-containing protein [Moraxellaceae bacterium]
MAGSSLLLLIDDIAAALDDVAVMTKIAAKKTAGVLGDDLALNAQQVSGVSADRELPVVWAVAKGSAKNKAILVPAALLISAFIPWLITPLLMIGGAYLCYEGFEKLAHKFLHSAAEEQAEQDALTSAFIDPEVDLVAFEQEKIKGAIRTDFVLSAEIIVITLGSVTEATFGVQVAAVISIAILMTVGVYGFVALIVKLDDMGLHLLQKKGSGNWLAFQHKVGGLLLATAPVLMRTLGVLGTIAMFLVGGGILVHGLPFIHGLTHGIEQFGGLAVLMGSSAINFVVGIVAGAVVLGVVTVVTKLFKK